MAARYLKAKIDDSAINAELIFQKMTNGSSGKMEISEDQSLYKVRTATKMMK